MTNEYICKQDVVEAVDRIFDNVPMELTTEILRLRRELRELPSADVAPVRHGRWVKYTGMGKEQWMCSECSAEEKNPKVANYCYHCGAKMDGGKED